MAFIRGNENLKTKGGEPIDGRKLSAGAVLVSREKFRDLWMKVRDECEISDDNYLQNLYHFQSTFKGSHFGEEFHTYELLWTDRSIEVSVDGISYGTIEGGFRDLARTNNVTVSSQLYAGEYMAPFDKEV